MGLERMDMPTLDTDDLGPLMRAVGKYTNAYGSISGPIPDLSALATAVRRKAEQYGAMKVANVYAEECGIVRCACLMTGDRTSCAERAKTARAAYFEEEQR